MGGVLPAHRRGDGGPVVLDLLLAAVLDAGARPARPGEFSERAFLNDKLDLAQAEAIAVAADRILAADPTDKQRVIAAKAKFDFLHQKAWHLSIIAFV